MICPKCQSENVKIQVINEVNYKKVRHNLLWWIFIGWWWIPIKWTIFTIPAMILSIFHQDKIKVINKQKKICVCQNCGTTWTPKYSKKPKDYICNMKEHPWRFIYLICGIILIIEGILLANVSTIGFILFIIGIILICLRKKLEGISIKNNKKTSNLPQNLNSIHKKIEDINSKEPIFLIHSSKDTDKNIKQLQQRFIVFDTETTGINPNSDRMVSIAAIVFENGIPKERFYSLVNPGRHIPDAASEINGITDEMVKDAPSESEVVHKFCDFIGEAISGKTLLVAYNSIYDAKILKNAAERNGIKGNIRHFDVLTYARKNLPALVNYKQTTVAKHFKINTDNAHNSMRDCEICAEILQRLLIHEVME